MKRFIVCIAIAVSAVAAVPAAAEASSFRKYECGNAGSIYDGSTLIRSVRGVRVSCGMARHFARRVSIKTHLFLEQTPEWGFNYRGWFCMRHVLNDVMGMGNIYGVRCSRGTSAQNLRVIGWRENYRISYD